MHFEIGLLEHGGLRLSALPGGLLIVPDLELDPHVLSLGNRDRLADWCVEMLSIARLGQQPAHHRHIG